MPAANQNRFSFFALPPEDLNLAIAADETLETFGILPQPRNDDLLREFWRKLTAPPFAVIKPEFPEDATDTRPSACAGGGRPGLHTRGHLEQSQNWSGGFITPPRPNRFDLIVGSWKVPAVTMPTEFPLGAASQTLARSSIWIGLDGRSSRLPKSSMPQIGTSQFIDATTGVVDTFAWWEWWWNSTDTRDETEPQHFIRVLNFDVRPGDEILAGMRVIVSRDVVFFMKNQRTGEYFSFLSKSPGEVEPIGSTAEWIMERPIDPVQMKLFALPDYGSVDITYCIAQSAEQPFAQPTTHLLSENGRFIRMRETFADPYRSSPVSIAVKTGAASLRCSYAKPS